MSLTRAQLTTQTRNVMNAVSSGQWTDAEIQDWLGLAHWQEYANLLNAINTYTLQQVSVTQDVNGQFALSALSTGTGDTAKNFYRILALAQPATSSGVYQFFYQQTKFQMYPNPQPNTAMPYVWYRFGSYIQVLPVQQGIGLTVSVNYRPPRVNQLSTDSIAVDFPDGYEPILSWRAAALALRKGGSEVPAANEMDRMADEMRALMLMDLGRTGTQPTIAGALDDISDWGSSA
jgi:hypothetical protein